MSGSGTRCRFSLVLDFDRSSSVVKHSERLVGLLSGIFFPDWEDFLLTLGFVMARLAFELEMGWSSVNRR